MLGSVITLLLSGAPPSDVPRLPFQIVARISISAQKPLYSLVKASANGLIYVGDNGSAEIQALARTGELVWSASLAPELESGRKALRAMALDRRGLLLVLESGSGDVHVLDGQTGRLIRRVSVDRTVPPQTGLAPDDQGGFYLVGVRGVGLQEGPITHFRSDGTR